jgi:hypothetical protein
MAIDSTITLTPKELARFWSHVDQTPGQGPEGHCSSWRGSRSKTGYGQFGLRGKVERAHRVAYLIANGRWPMPCALHACDFPPCCETAHIFEGTQADNIADRSSKGRTARQRGDANGSRTHPERVSRGEANGNTKHSDEVIEAVRVAPGPRKEIAAKYGMSRQHVGLIKRGKTRIPLDL